MAPQNKYILRSKISEAKTRQLVKLLVIDLTATQLAQVTGLNRNTVNRIVVGIREYIAAACEEESPVKGGIEVDESYNGLVNLGYKKLFRVQHGESEFATKTCHINGIESFWGYAKTRLMRFRGLAKHTFYLHLKECEFRFNHRGEDLYQVILKMLRENPLS